MSTINATRTALPTNGVPAPIAPGQPAAGAQPQAVAGNAAINTGYSPQPAASMPVARDVSSAISNLVAGAYKDFQDVSNQIANGTTSDGKPMDAAKLQAYSSRLTVYEMTMQMAAKLQEKEERAASVWLRP